MGLRDSNRDRIWWWTERDWANRMPGSPDPEQLYEGKKSEGRVPMKGPSWDSVDAHYTARRTPEQRIALGISVEDQSRARRFADSHKIMLYLVDEYMPEYHPNLDRMAREWVLNEFIAGGHTEYKNLKKQAEMGNPYAAAITETLEWWVDRMLDVLDHWNYRLWVEKDETFESKIQERNVINNLQRVLRKEDSYRYNYRKLQEIEAEFPEAGRGEHKAIFLTREHKAGRDISKRTLERSISFCEGAENL